MGLHGTERGGRSSENFLCLYPMEVVKWRIGLAGSCWGGRVYEKNGTKMSGRNGGGRAAAESFDFFKWMITRDPAPKYIFVMGPDHPFGLKVESGGARHLSLYSVTFLGQMGGTPSGFGLDRTLQPRVGSVLAGLASIANPGLEGAIPLGLQN